MYINTYIHIKYTFTKIYYNLGVLQLILIILYMYTYTCILIHTSILNIHSPKFITI